jgi:hypothetical protein
METEKERKEKWKALREFINTIELKTYTIRPHVYTSGHTGLTGSPECKQCWLPIGELKVGFIFYPNEPEYKRIFKVQLSERSYLVPDQYIVIKHDDLDMLKHMTIAVVNLIKVTEKNAG